MRFGGAVLGDARGGAALGAVLYEGDAGAAVVALVPGESGVGAAEEGDALLRVAGGAARGGGGAAGAAAQQGAGGGVGVGAWDARVVDDRVIAEARGVFRGALLGLAVQGAAARRRPCRCARGSCPRSGP